MSETPEVTETEVPEENSSNTEVVDYTSVDETDAETGLPTSVKAILDQADDSPPRRSEGNSEESTETESKETSTDEEKETKPEKEDTFSKRFAALSRREKELNQRDQELKEKYSMAEALEQAAANYHDDPMSFIDQALTSFFGQDESAVEEGFAELFNAMSARVLGVDAPAEMQEQNQYKKLQRDFENYKNEQEQAKQRAQEEALELQRQTQIMQAQANIKTELAGQKEEFPLLLGQAEYDPGEMVWEIIWQDYNMKVEAGQENPDAMSTSDAARKAEEYFHGIAKTWLSLLPADNANQSKQSTGQPAKNRPSKARTLTNNKASVAPTKVKNDFIEDPDDAKEAILKKYGALN